MKIDSTDLDKLEVQQPERRVTQRRPIQFSVRALLLLVSMAGVAISLMAFVLQRNRRHNHAVQELQQAGAKVEVVNGWACSVDLTHYTVSSDSANQPAPDRDVELKLLRDLPGLEKLFIRHTAVDDDDLKLLVALHDLKELDLTSTRVTDEGLKHVSQLSDLESLRLAQTAVTDAGLAHLRGLQELKLLDLRGTTLSQPSPTITDKGLKFLSIHTKLEELNLYAARISDAGLAHLRGMTSLRKLDLTHHNVSFDAASENEDGTIRLKPLSDFPKGKRFSTGEITDLIQITDAGLVHLSKLHQLKELNLGGTIVSDAGLSHYESFADLEILDLSSTLVTREGVQSLQRGLPNCQIAF